MRSAATSTAPGHVSAAASDGVSPRVLGGFGIAAVMLTACGGPSGETEPSTSRRAKILHVYNWTDYIGRTTIADFEAKTGIKVVYDTYDSNELVETKLLTGRSGYDVVFPTATVLAVSPMYRSYTTPTSMLTISPNCTRRSPARPCTTWSLTDKHT